MAQIIIAQCICVGFQIYISRTQVVRRVYIATFMSNLAFMLMYFVNSDIGTMVSCGFITIRSLVYIFKPQIKGNPVFRYLTPFIAIAIQVAIGLTFMESYWQILTIIGGSWTHFSMWFFDTTQHLRASNVLGNSIWLAYDLHGSLFIVVIGRAVMIATNLIAYMQHREDGMLPVLRESVNP